MDKDSRPLACFHCGSHDKLRSHEECDCDGEGRRVENDSIVQCELCDHSVCGDCFEYLQPIFEKEGLDHERN